jgi:transposase-like protein
MNSNRSGRRYDREFKSNAVALVRAGRTITEVARDLRAIWASPNGQWATG